MKYNKHLCPHCDGLGKIYAAFHPIIIKCDFCKSTGIINNKQQLRYEQGQKLKKYRLEILKLTLRAACKKYNIDPSNLSKMERGIIKPKNIYLKDKMKLTN